MLHAQKAALENSLRQRLVSIRERELEYYTKNCRLLGDLAALVAGFAFSGIRYHYLLERQHSWMVQDGDAVEEVIFLSLLTITLGFGLQTVLIAMLVAMLGPSLALRGPDGSLHDAVDGMQGWNSVMLIFFMTSLIMLQMSALSFAYGHAQMNLALRSILCSTILATTFATFHYSRVVIQRFRLPTKVMVTGAFFDASGAPLSESQLEAAANSPQRSARSVRRAAQAGLGAEGAPLIPAGEGAVVEEALDTVVDTLDDVLDETLELADATLLGSKPSPRWSVAAQRRGGQQSLLGQTTRLIKVMLGAQPDELALAGGPRP